ncbi:hypothetical protein DPMN_145697 [Dreissena polymorpha]|uniref:Uncharacterized protein n=1 Tax=Dreissena polymorpha TaxID=45954 RepID=A0A9D4F8Z3_DREPO|nr:hypothetical protein DPMN_145697 [Dreissena polymorpha]
MKLVGLIILAAICLLTAEVAANYGYNYPQRSSGSGSGLWSRKCSRLCFVLIE